MEKLPGKSTITSVVVILLILFCTSAKSEPLNIEVHNNGTPLNLLYFQNFNPKPDSVVGEINGHKITFDELVNNYYSTVPSIQKVKKHPSYDQLKEYLNLYLSYRAKLAAAREAGYFQQKKIRTEFEEYRHQYAYTYWWTHKIEEHLINQLLTRSKTEVNVSYIFISLSPTAPPRDTLKVWGKLMEAYKQFEQGVPFKKLIKEYSSKRKNGKFLGGESGYFSAGRTFMAFENAAYTTRLGGISKPFRGRDGYYLVHVRDKRPTVPDRLVDHIYFPIHGPGNSVKKAMAKAKLVYRKLVAGIPWDTLVTKYSEDPRSKFTDGSLGWVNRNQYNPTLSEKIFSTKKLHTFSHPFISTYGVHIIRVDSIKAYSSPEEKRKDFEKKLKYLRGYFQRSSLIFKYIEHQGHAESFVKNYHIFVKNIIDNKSNVYNLHLSNTLLKEPLYEINNKKYTINDFINWFEGNNDKKQQTVYHYYDFLNFKKYATDQQAVDITQKEFPDFEKKVSNYFDGLVVYQITQDSIWNYVSRDTADLRTFYKSHLDEYRLPLRYEFHIIASNQSKLIKRAVELIKNGTSIDEIRPKMENQLRSDKNGFLFMRKEVVNNVDTDHYPYSYLKELKKHELSRQFMLKNEKCVFYLDEKLPGRPMTFKEAYNKLVEDYQPIRKKQWLAELENKYSVKKYPEKIKQILENQKPK